MTKQEFMERAIVCQVSKEQLDAEEESIADFVGAKLKDNGSHLHSIFRSHWMTLTGVTEDKMHFQYQDRYDNCTENIELTFDEIFLTAEERIAAEKLKKEQADILKAKYG